MRVVQMRRGRWITIWSASWLAFALAHAMLMYAQSFGAMGISLSLRVALLTTLAPAAMSVGVWRLTERYAWDGRRPAAFATIHSVAGLLFAGLWAGWTFTVAQLRSGARMPARVMLHTALPWQLVIGSLLYALVCALSYALRSFVHARNMALAAEQAERLRAQAHLAALRAHIDPHFLFNVLHCVSELLIADPAVARRALEHLSDIFRYTLRLDRQNIDLVSIEEEWAVVESYLWLESLRLGPRLRVCASLDDEVLSCTIPPFTLQPIVENAVRHGLSPKPAGGTLSVRLFESDGAVVSQIADDGMGCDVASCSASQGLGVRSVRQRLRARFGEDATVQIESCVDGGTTVTIRFPAVVHSSPRVMRIV